ncbi:MAG: RDD family protein [Saprospiraceae bacterium]|nr:RDD family protein [Saprospiraceae bacterium]
MENVKTINQVLPRKPQKAEWWRRLIGNLIDSTLLIIILPSDVFPEYIIGTSLEYYTIMWYYVIYCLVLEGIFNRTLGKLVTGTIVISTRTFEKPSFGQILGRSFSRLIPFDGLSFISSNPWGWHDSIPNTMVTTVKSWRLYKTGNTGVDYSSTNFWQKQIVRLKSVMEDDVSDLKIENNYQSDQTVQEGEIPKIGIQRNPLIKNPFRLIWKMVTFKFAFHKEMINEGDRRLLIIISLFVPFLLSMLYSRGKDEYEEYYIDGESFCFAFIWIYFLFHIAVRIYKWVIDGYNLGKKKIKN